MPLIQIPYSRLREKCNLTSVLHEAGHQSLTRLHLVSALPHALRAALNRAGAPWVTAGLNGNARPFGRVEGTVFRTHPYWFRNGAEDNDFDYGMITLKDPIGERRFKSLAGAPLGWWGDSTNGGGTRLERLDPKSLDNITVNVAGYPNDKPGGRLWMSSGRTAPLRDPNGQITTAARRLPHNADTHSSQSGSPVWMRDTEKNLRYLKFLRQIDAWR